MEAPQDPVKEARQFLSDAWRMKVEFCLWQGHVLPPKGVKLSKETAEKVRVLEPAIKQILTRRLVTERKSREDHAWILRLGDKPGVSRITRPAFLVCGARSWCQRLINQAAMFEAGGDRYRWILLNPEQVGSIFEDDRSRLVAGLLTLPDSVALGGPKDSRAHVLSACHDCIRSATAKPSEEDADDD